MYTRLPVVKSALVHDPASMDDIPLILAKQCDTRLSALSAYLLWGDDPDNITCQEDAARLLSGEICTDPGDPAYNGYLLPILIADHETAKATFRMVIS